MSIIAWIILGGVAGWLASMVMKTDASQGLLANIVVGIVGAVIGGFILGLFGGSGVTGFNVYSLLTAFGGAVVLLAILRAIKRGPAATG